MLVSAPPQTALRRRLPQGWRPAGLAVLAILIVSGPLPRTPAAEPPQGGPAPAGESPTEKKPAAPAEEPAPPPAEPAPPPAGVTAAEVRGQIESLAANESLADDARASLRETYEQALAAVKQATADRAELESLREAAASAPDRQAAAEQALEQPVKAEQLGVDASAEMADIEAARREASGRLAALTDDLKELKARITERRQESKTLPQEVVELEQELAKKKQPPPADDDVDPVVARAQQMLREAAEQAAAAAVDLARQKLRTYEAEATVLPLEQQLLEREIAAVTARVEGLTKLGSAKRKDVIESRRAEFEQALAGVSEDRRREASVTVALLDSWGDLAGRSRQFASDLVETRERATSLQADLNETEALVNSDLETGGSLSRSVGFLLVRTRAKLPGDGQLAEQAAAQSRSVDDTQEVLARVGARLDELDVAQDAKGGRPEIDTQERGILQTMNRDAERYLVETLIPLGVQQQSLRRVVREYRRLIDGHLLWVQSDRPLRFHNLKDTAAGVRALVEPARLRRLANDLVTAVSARPFAVLAGLASVVALLVLHRWFVRQIVRLGGVVAGAGALRMAPTLMAMGVTILAAIPAWLGLWLVSWLLSSMSAADSFGASFAAGLAAAAQLLLPLEFLRQFLRPHGVAAAHFNWSPAVTGPLRQAARRAASVALPTLFFWRLLDFESGTGAEINTAARLVFIVLMVLVAVILWLLVRPASGFARTIVAGWGGAAATRLTWLWQILVVAAPLALAVLMGLGYGYSAVQLAHSLQQSLWVLMTSLVIHGLAVRWLLISRRRIALDQLRQRAAERAQAEAGSAVPGVPPVHDDTVLDVSTINQQTRRLIDAALFVGLLAGLLWIWAPVLPALEFLDRVTLWQQRAADGSVTGAVTLANLLVAIPIVVLTFVVVHNAPGLLEAAVLRHLPIDNAGRYAITTLVSYLLAGLGLVLAAATLGLSWSSVQWLVAGLSVGLGFGLQEIVANFICGIILLFEQPIRPGDIVTLDGVTGIVSRIRIRATTVTTYERQEYIVPNKDLITGRVTNWTLSDNVNRAEVRVGVAYGTDTRKACEMLREICREHPEVLDDPAPLITFQEFGDSALLLVLRMYLGSLDHRLDTINDVHTMIHERFNAAAIEIAFPQLDVHFRNPPGQ
jgi:potassium efflux system protein